MVNPELNNSPALRISNVVYGRERREDGRVTYLINSNSDETRVIPEEIVLKRWRNVNLYKVLQEVSG